MTAPAGPWAWPLVREKPTRHLTGKTLVAVVEGSSIFTHWLIDTLPRLEGARQAGYPLESFDNFLFATAKAGFCRESFAALDIDPAKVKTRLQLGNLISCDEIVYVSAPRDRFFASGWVYDFVTGTFLSKDRERLPKRRIYISRANAARRRILNEEALQPILTAHGFEIVKAEALGIRGMAELCAEATHVVAPHGAGLSNLVFLPPGGKVLELYGAHLSTEYWRICSQRGHHYYCLQGTAANGEPYTHQQIEGMTFFERNGADLVVDPAAFTAALELILET